jgi:hypothetical protein
LARVLAAKPVVSEAAKVMAEPLAAIQSIWQKNRIGAVRLPLGTLVKCLLAIPGMFNFLGTETVLKEISEGYSQLIPRGLLRGCFFAQTT